MYQILDTPVINSDIMSVPQRITKLGKKISFFTDDIHLL